MLRMSIALCAGWPKSRPSRVNKSLGHGEGDLLRVQPAGKSCMGGRCPGRRNEYCPGVKAVTVSIAG